MNKPLVSIRKYIIEIQCRKINFSGTQYGQDAPISLPVAVFKKNLFYRDYSSPCKGLFQHHQWQELAMSAIYTPKSEYMHDRLAESPLQAEFEI